jgi:hypothetical protein
MASPDLETMCHRLDRAPLSRNDGTCRGSVAMTRPATTDDCANPGRVGRDQEFRLWLRLGPAAGNQRDEHAERGERSGDPDRVAEVVTNVGRQV